MNEATAKWKAQLKKVGILCLASGGFSGYFPVASGTAGSLVGVGIVWLTRDAGLFFQCALCAFLAGVGVWASQEAGILFKEADSSRIVIDEIVGLMVTMIGIPVNWYWLAFGFLLFRFFDITKLPPANYFDQKMKNGWGVMLDDVVAGVYGNIILHLVLRATV